MESGPPERGGPQQDAAPLLQHENNDAGTASTAAGSGDEPGGEPAQAERAGGWSFLAWLSGRRRDAQRLPADDDEEELQERGGAGAPTVAVVVEAAADAGASPAAAAAAAEEGRQVEQPAAASGSGSQAGQAAASGSGGGDGEIEPRSSAPTMARLPSRGQPTCLICLEEFRQEEFINGSALRLECNCRGDLALRHRDCVMKWVQVKGSNVCELCKAEIRNIPAPPPRAADPGDLPVLDEAYFSDPAHIHDFMPSSQDLVFDCIRVTWVAMIVSILFFEMSLGAALWTGLLAGMAYSVMVRLMYRSHFMAMRRLAEQQAAARREAEQQAAGPGAADAAPGGAAPPVVAVV